ncbi:acyl-CoA reductase [Chryseolinea sp. H1M3-3]|uniref:acyl-CoA reductase n=1 Tax=Chryseolinea sp. H1M3-3 TaxID=3034144 RepID=UPI0023EDB969|nr:acyl-CoA reductase [Chryseolinea sp. H1M3-3]
MNIEERIEAFVQLGEFIESLPEEKFKTLAERIRIENAWFTESNLRMAVSGIVSFLDEKKLRSWLSAYPLVTRSPKIVALIMAGNIPLVGFHDLLCVLINGDIALIKPSSKDSILLRIITDKLAAINPGFADKIIYTERLKDFDAVIATGSDNSSRYFEYYFGKYPHIIRKNRTSVAILNGHEDEKDLEKLGKDVFSYFGLGCRNVSKLYVPRGYDFQRLFKSWQVYKDLDMHHKYHNNYHYQRTVLLVATIPYLDTGFVLLQESERLVSPIAVLYYEYYNAEEDLSRKLNTVQDKLQCIVGNFLPATVKFGEAQCPGLNDYADGIDVMFFLRGLD